MCLCAVKILLSHTEILGQLCLGTKYIVTVIIVPLFVLVVMYCYTTSLVSLTCAK